MLNLDRPLLVLDLEATSVDPDTARIIQVGYVKIEMVGDKPMVMNHYSQLVSPGVPVPEEVREKTGIADSDLEREGIPFAEVAEEALTRVLRRSDLCGYNLLTYDIPLLEAEYDRLGKSLPSPENRRVVDVYQLERELNPRTLGNTYQRYTGEEFDDAHDAQKDAEATWRVLQEQIGNHDLEATSPEEIETRQRGDYLDADRKLKDVDGAVQVCFGKHEGKTLHELRDMDRDYLTWMYREIEELQPHIDEAFE